MDSPRRWPGWARHAGFGTPVTGGNVSFYNQDIDRAVFPTPTIGMLGIVDDLKHVTTQWFQDEGDLIYLIGENKEELGASEYIHTIFGKNTGPIPELDLQFEKDIQDTVYEAIKSGIIKSAHDCADGGLAVALAECCISNKEEAIGAKIHIDENLRADCLLFGETQSRIIVSVDKSEGEKLVELCANNNIPISAIGKVGGDILSINDIIDLPLTEMIPAFYDSLGKLMAKA